METNDSNMTKRLLARWTAGAVLAAAMALSGALAAQTPDDVAASKAAFDSGMTAMEAGNYDQACPLLEKAQNLDPGMAGQFRLAQCYEHQGRLASAWRNYVQVQKAARAAGMKAREDDARAHAAALEPRLSRVTIRVPPEVAKVPGLRITRNGEDIASALWGAAEPVDAGAVRVEASAPGHAPWSTEVVVDGEGEAATVEVLGPRAPVQPDGKPQPGAGSGAGDEPAGMSGQAIAGIAIAAVGVVAMGAGVGIGVAAKSHWEESNEQGRCLDDRCHPDGLDIRDEAYTQGTVGTVVFFVGAACAVGGGVLWLLAPSDEPSSEPMAASLGLGITANGMTLGGVW